MYLMVEEISDTKQPLGVDKLTVAVWGLNKLQAYPDPQGAYGDSTR